MRCTPLCDTISKWCCTIGGVSRMGPLRLGAHQGRHATTRFLEGFLEGALLGFQWGQVLLEGFLRRGCHRRCLEDRNTPFRKGSGVVGTPPSKGTPWPSRPNLAACQLLWCAPRAQMAYAGRSAPAQDQASPQKSWCQPVECYTISASPPRFLRATSAIASAIGRPYLAPSHIHTQL